jgi:hypothetical protein
MSIEWYLTHDPLTVGYATQDAAVRLLVLRRPLGLPGIKVFFAIEGDTVTALRVTSFRTPTPSANTDVDSKDTAPLAGGHRRDSRGDARATG